MNELAVRGFEREMRAVYPALKFGQQDQTLCCLTVQEVLVDDGAP